MCRMCDQQNSILTQEWLGSGALAGIAAHYQRASVSRSVANTAFLPEGLPDGVGEKLEEPAPSPADLLAAAAVPDDIPADATTTRTVTVGGPRIVSTINTPGDQDWFKVVLQAGVTYEIGQYGTRFGPTGVPLRDPLVEIYNSSGTLLRSDDSGGPASNVSDDALLVFTPEVSGVYYINARAWDTRDPVGLSDEDINPATTTGDYVGDYEVFARVSTLEPDYYHIRYETVDDPSTARNEIGMPTLDSSPLHSLDWPGVFDGTSRNPDGQEGPRPTGNPVESKLSGKNILYYYFAREGDIFVDDAADPLGLTTTIVAQGMQEWEKNAFELALDKYEMVADLLYIETEDRYAADIIVITYEGTPGIESPSLLGRMSPPDTANEGQTEFNSGDYRWTPQGLAPGGMYFGTLIHELGHGHGMSHPHDKGGGRSSIMRGVEETEPLVFTYGDFELNQGVYTMMSYNFGWETSPYGQAPSDVGYGYIGSLMAFDIAVIQDKYGVNEEWATGNDTYTLKDENVDAQFDAQGNMTREPTNYSSIWDAGGIDEIVYNGAKNANIDLRAATLKYEYGGGGWVSYAYGIYGGFTIANAVTIENAKSGSGNDTLRGNSVDNVLDSGAGHDLIFLMDGGVDTAIAGPGNDVFLFGAAMTSADKANGGLGTDQIALQGDYAGAEALTFGADVLAFESIAFMPGNDTRFGDAGTNFYSYEVTTLDGNIASGVQVIVDAARLRVGENVVFNGSAESDGSFFYYGGNGIDTVTGGAKNDVFLFGAEGQWGTSDSIVGGAGADQLALRGNYTVTFGAAQLSSIENVGLVSALDTRFGALGTTYSYNLTFHDGNVASGVQLTIDGATLRATETMIINGAGEVDGSFRMFGGAGADIFTGGQGADVMVGGGAADYLKGGPGADSYRYREAAESTSTNFDRIDGFQFGTDEIDLPGTHDSYGSQSIGVLNSATFDTNLAVAMTGILGPSQAVFFAPNAGDMVGRLFLVVDMNGNAGYQAGEDIVIEFLNSTPPPLISMPDFIV